MPRASQMPTDRDRPSVTPSPVNPLGVEGLRRGGYEVAAAVVNAVCDALSPFGIRHIDKPLTPGRVWAAIQQPRAWRSG